LVLGSSRKRLEPIASDEEADLHRGMVVWESGKPTHPDTLQDGHKILGGEYELLATLPPRRPQIVLDFLGTFCF